jgi:hypothetical protein
MPQPDVFTAGALADPDGKFVSAIFDIAKELQAMSEVGRNEFTQIVARTQVPMPVAAGDPELRARLAAGSIAIKTELAPTVKTSGGLIR